MTAANSPLTLYHHGSSACAAKVRLVLEEKQLRWDSSYVDLMRGEQFAADYLALNPKGVVPTLVHNGRVIPESTVICEYLDDTFAEYPVYPADTYERAQVRLWAKAVDEELHPACSALTYVVSHRHTIIRNGVGSFEDFLAAGRQEGRAARERKWSWIEQGLEAPGVADQLRVYVGFIARMEQALGQADWLVANRFSMADIAMTPYVNRLHALALNGVWEHGRYARVGEWFARIRSRPSFAAAVERWMPDALAAEMRRNGEKAWPQVERLLAPA
jgi:glutathione S-transferase